MEAQGKEPVEWVPTQYKPTEIVDLRAAKQGPKGYKERTKRKLEEMEAQHQQDQEEADARMDDDEAQPAEAAAPSEKRHKVDEAKFIPVSGRVWKAPATRAGVVMKPKVGTSWEKKMAERASRQAFMENKKETVAAAKEKRKAAAAQRKAAAERKKVNRAKSEVVQKVSTATVKKMMKSKKQKKLLRTADTN